MRRVVIVYFALAAALSFAQEVVQQQTSSPLAQRPTGSCLAVRPIGSHAFRNVMLFGVAGALISHQQYEIVDAVNYPAKVGQKFHGNDLQTISSGGIKVSILDKHYTAEDLHKACQGIAVPALEPQRSRAN